MNRAQKSQIREILLQLADLKRRLKTIFWDPELDMSANEEVAIKKTLAGLKAAINDLIHKVKALENSIDRAVEKWDL